MSKRNNVIYGKAISGHHFVTLDTRRSILECRSIYHDMTELQFVAWYERRYKIKAGTVLAVLNENKSSPA